MSNLDTVKEVANLIDTHKPNKGRWDFEPGDIAMYREGIVKAKVEIVSKRLDKEAGTYRLRLVEQLGRFPLPKEFECMSVFEYAGNSCWSLRPLPEGDEK